MTRVKPPGKIDGKNPIYIYIARFQLKPGLVGTFVLNKFCIYILSEWSVAFFSVRVSAISVSFESSIIRSPSSRVSRDD